MAGVRDVWRLVQRFVEPRRGDRRVEQRRARRTPVPDDRRSGADRRVRERREAY